LGLQVWQSARGTGGSARKRPDLLVRLTLALILGLAGLALNNAPLGDLSRLWPGRIVTLPVALLLGPAFGAAAGAIGALAFAQHPLLVAFFVLEAVVLGSFARRGRSSLIVAPVFWGVGALIFVASPSWFSVGLARQVIWRVALQQLLMAMVAVAIAEFFSQMAVARFATFLGRRPRRLRGTAFHAFVLAAVLPVLI
jgi:hypothetical protein